MLILDAELLKVETLEAKGDYPASHLVKVLDPETDETLTLVANDEVADALASAERRARVVLKLAWRRQRLDRGAAYRLRVIGLVNS